MAATTIEFAPLLSWGILSPVLALAGLVVLFAIWRGARGAWWRAGLMLFLALLLARPSLVEERREPLKDIALVVIDETPSMKIAGRDGERDTALKRLNRQLEGYASTVERRVLRIRHDGVGDGAHGTRLAGPMIEALGDIPPSRAAGVFVLTDGQIHDMPSRLDRVSLPAPIHLLLAGAPDLPDRRLVVVDVPAYGIVGTEVEVSVKVEDAGAAPGSRARLTLKRDGVDLGTSEIEIGKTHSLKVELEHGGPSVIELIADPGRDELMLENNRAVLSINGVRDRLRVLLVSGEPHPGERTWRNLLKSDPSVDLVHFTILRPPEKQDGTPINELSLISFPTRELFEVKLADFDLVIFDRYRRRGVLPPVYLQNVVDYVREGGALLEAVGPSFATPFSLYRTPLGKVLPAEPSGRIIERPYRPAVSALGRRHPVTAGLPGGTGKGERRWGRWLRQIDASATRGRILMTGAEDKPLLVLDRFGKGRVAQINSDHIWLWARGFEGGGPQAELLRRLAHWLMKEPDLEENDLRIGFDGSHLEIVRRSLEKAKSNEVELTGPDGTTRRMTLREAPGGRSVARLAVEQAGLYSVRDGARRAMTAAGALNAKEVADLRSTAKTMAPFAARTKGGIFWLRGGAPDLRRTRPGRTTHGRDWIGLRRNDDYIVTGVRRTPLPPALLALLLGFALLAGTWWREGE